MSFLFVPQWGFSVVAELPWGERSEREACGPLLKALWLTFPERWVRRLLFPRVCGPDLSVSELFLPRGRKSVRARLCVLRSRLWFWELWGFHLILMSWSYRLNWEVPRILWEASCSDRPPTGKGIFSWNLFFFFFLLFKNFSYFLFFQFYWDIVDAQKCISLRCPA